MKIYLSALGKRLISAPIELYNIGMVIELTTFAPVTTEFLSMATPDESIPVQRYKFVWFGRKEKGLRVYELESIT